MNQIFTFILLAGMTVWLLACSSPDGAQEAKEGSILMPTAASEVPTGTPESPVEMQAPKGKEEATVGVKTPAGTAVPLVETETPKTAVTPPLETRVSSGAVTLPRAVPLPYDGPISLEERALESPVIARVRLDSVSSSAESGNTYQGTKYIALLEFSFSVEEYLKGSGADDIVAVWAAGPFFNTEKEARDALTAISGARDTQWDNREAIVFLKQDFQEFLPSTRRANRFYLAWGGGRSMDAPDDGYSLASRHNRLWLPAAAAAAGSQNTGDQQRFLMAVPPATGTATTLTLGEIKTRIGAVTTKLGAGDGSEAYTECVQRTYRHEGDDRYSVQTGGDGHFYRTPDGDLGSGLAASSVVYELLALGALPDGRDEVWLDGGDGDLFRVELGDGVPHDYSGDGTNDSIQYTQRVVSARPLPVGVYRTHYNNRHVDFVLCDGYATRHEWTVTVNAPVGTLHEAFFDPVTDGMSVAADGTKGALKPASFTGANRASATLERIEWKSGTVKVEVNPDNALTGQLLDFLELDGTVSLSLSAVDATVDTVNDSLSWAVESQPWEDGDLLMVRIRRAPASCSSGVVVTNPGSAPGLVQDCETLLWVKDLLVGTGSLNWSADTAISSWNGVTVGGSPQRVTGLALASRSLSGSIPARLAELTMLNSLDLGSNQLVGQIPSQLGSLAHLTRLRMAGNSFSGCIPPTLRKVSNHDLDSLNLKDCITKAPVPEGLSVSLADTTFSITWSAITGEVTYQLQTRTGGEEGEWTGLKETRETTQTYSPEGGPLCETTYDFRVRARGDGTSYTDEWSEPSQSVSHTTGMCNQAPTFTSSTYDFSVAENTSTDGAVGTVTATDPNEGDTVSYTLSAGNEDGKFAIDSTNGEMTVAGPLDHETTDSYSLTVTVEDEGGLSDTAEISIEITDVNEAPSFRTEEYTLTIAENATVSAAAATFSATDPDEDTLTYSITAGDDDRKFRIDRVGTLFVAKALDHETTGSYTLTVEASDPDSLSDTATVTITVMDVNEAPSFGEEEYSFTVPENSATGRSVGTAVASDPDAGNTLTYSITGEAFGIDASGAVTVSAALDHETTESYSLTVTATDGKGLSDTATVSITVMDVNEAPSFGATTYTFTVPENAVLSELLGTVSATDPDADDTLTYSIGGEDFTIDASGAVTVARLLDYETTKSYSLTATVADGGGLSGTATVSITVTDVDETPAFDSDDYSFTVSGDAAVGTVVGTLTASDANERQGQTLAYHVEGDSAFTIDGSTGALKVATALDYETFITHDLTATVTDETDLSDTASVSIRVRDVAEVTPPTPRGLTARLRIRADRFDLSWNAVDGSDRYRIQYRIGGTAGKWTNLESTTGTSQIFSPEGGIRCSTDHQFKVQAHGDGETHPARWGSRSHSVAAAVRGCIFPHAPTGLTAKVEDGSVVLSWTGPTNTEITAYQILRRRPTAEQQLLVLVENTGSTSTTYTDSTVEAGVHYIYRVKAINNTAIGPISNRAQVRIPR